MQVVRNSRGESDDSQFEVARLDRMACLFRIHEADVETDRRIGSPERLQDGGEAMQADVVAGAHDQRTCHGIGERGGEASHILGLVQQLARARKQGPAGLGQGGFSADAVEEQRAEFVLECLDALADCRLGDEQRFCGT